MSQPVNLRIQN